MRNSLPLLSRPPVATTAIPQAGPPIPSIRLISATPSATGLSSEASTSFNRSLEESWATMPSPLAPKTAEVEPARRRLVPKKSKLSILGVGRDKEKERGKDFSDVIRRVGADYAGGIEIYVDPTIDPDIGEIVMVKKKKSRVALDGMAWGANDVTNVPKVTPKEAPTLLKVKTEEKEKWWSIGRGRKDSKEKTKEAKENKISSKPVEYIHDPHPRSKTPEPFKSTSTQESRGRFNSLDSGILLNGPINMGPAPGSVHGPHTLNFPEDQFPSSGEPSPVNLTYSRSGTPTAGGLLAPPSTLAVPGSGSNNNNQGSIAIRAMRSVRSLARMGSWAQLKNMPPPEDKDAPPAASTKEKKKSVKEKAVKEKTVKEKTVKEKKKAKENRVEEEKGAEKEKKKKSLKKEKEKAQTVRQSSSSFEVGALTASPGSDAAKTLGPKKRSILGLGLGLPSTVRLPSVRAGSTASSNINIGANPAPGPGPVSSYHRLSADSALQLNRAGSTERRGSVVSSASAGSSLRPLSTTSSTSRASSRSSGGSVRWDEEGLETVREQRNKEREERRKDEERAERRTSRESKHSVEGRRRTSLAAVFPEVQPQQQPVMSSPASAASTATVEGRRHSYPILTIEEATVDGHGVPDDGDDEMVVDEEKCQEEEEVVQASVAATPVKKARARPLSEQLLGKSRPKPMYEEDEGVLSILDAATNDLALLINTLDLQATPSTPDLTPFRPSPLSTVEKATPTGAAGFDGSPKNLKKHLVAESPLKKSYLATVSSVSSLRPYAQSRGYSKPTTTTTTTTAASSANNNVNAALIAKQIAPWATLMQGLSPVKEKTKATNNKATPTPPATSSSTFRPGHKRTMTPAPEPEPEPVFQPLRPARSRAMFPPPLLKVPVSPVDNDDSMDFGQVQERAPSSMTFGSRGSRESMDECSGSLTPVFKRIHEQESERERKRSRASLVPPPSDLASSRAKRGSQGSQRSSINLSAPTTTEECRIPIARETRRVLGMSGTMGGSDVSCYQAPEPDASDPDSDVPDELRFILATHSDRGSIAESLSYGDIGDAAMRPSSPTDDDMDIDAVPTRLSDSGPPTIALPVFRASLVDDEDNRCEIDEGANTSDEDTKKSFDFTGELQKLNESGGSDRRSFVEQLENAFRTPAKVDLRYDFGVGALLVEVPPVPELPVDFRMAVDAESSGSSNATTSSSDSNNGSSSGFDGYSSGSKLMEVKQPSILEKTSRPEFDSMQDSKSRFDMFSASRIVDIKEPTMLQGSDSLGSSSNETEDSLFSQISSPGLQPSPAASNRPSDGQLNTSFRFGGLPRMESTKSLPKDEEKPLTLSDIIPPPSHVRSLSESFNLDAFEDDSVLKSIYAKIVADVPPARPQVNSDSSTRQSARDKRRSIYKAMSRPTSGISFEGFDSFEEVRRGFEFSTDRPAFYPPPAVAASGAYRRAPHRRHQSVFSIASVSSYGHVINSGSNDPFDYGLPMPSLRERPSSEDMSSISMSLGDLEDTFAFVHNKPRRRVESDASSFYFRAPAPQQIGAIRGHRRRESNMSTSSQAPPISLYNRSFGHRRNDSTASASSVALSYARHGANSGFSAWARHRKDQSMDSVMSDFSGMHIGRPGLGDKMFDTQVDLGPLSSISASPPESASRPTFAADCTSYDSVIDEQRSSLENSDSIFERTDYDHHRESVSSDSVFGDDFAQVRKDGLLPPVQFRRLSIRSSNSVHSPMKEDDTMISMLGGGGHVRRRSIEASPCPHVEKRKHSATQGIQMYKGQDHYDSPNKARIVEKPSIASTSSFQFGGDRMIKAQHGLLERQSLEDSCLIADGEELISAYRAVPVFSRPGPAARSRSSTCTSSLGTDTPPLSASDGSSMSEGSQSSIDLSQINVALSNATHPMSTFSMNRVRARARGTGHRRRYSKAHISRSSVYETIEEEMMSSHSSSPAQSLLSKKSSPTTRQPIFIVDHDTASINSQPEEPTWDDERGIVALRKYYALRDEAHTTVSESRRLWTDTPFSLFAIQTFQAPAEPAGMQALLEHSVQTYGPLPSDLRPRRMRSRTSSRPSPYPQARISKGTLSPEQTRISNSIIDHQRTPVLQQKPVNKNIHMMATAPSLEALKPFSPLVMDIEPKRENAFGLAPNVRPRVGSTARRTALGWSKRSNGNGKSSTDQKENVAATGIVMTPGDTLRLNRPRARGRPTPGGRTPVSQNRAIRI